MLFGNVCMRAGEQACAQSSGFARADRARRMTTREQAALLRFDGHC